MKNMGYDFNVNCYLNKVSNGVIARALDTLQSEKNSARSNPNDNDNFKGLLQADE